MTAEIVIRIWKMIVFLVVSIALRVILAILPLMMMGLVYMWMVFVNHVRMEL